jgi:hypothetical protein
MPNYYALPDLSGVLRAERERNAQTVDFAEMFGQVHGLGDLGDHDRDLDDHEPEVA